MTEATARVREATFFEPDTEGRVRCVLCPHECRVPDGAKGACGVRVNRRGTLYTLAYDRVIARHIDPIEKKPLFHFLPGSPAYSISTVGCNLRCAFCQNWDISQWPKDHLARRTEWATDEDARVGCPELEALDESIPGEPITPEAVVRGALDAGAATIAYTYTEPTIFFELAYDTACLAREQGLRNIFVSNGFICEAPLRQIAGVLDAVNVDLKFFREESYRRVSRARLEPILDAIRLYHELGVWVEVTTLVVPGLNDSDEELRGIAEFVASVDLAIPWHVSQFYPAWKMQDTPVTPRETLARARRIGEQAGLRFVYEGNVPGSGGESTRCPGCSAVLIERYGLTMLFNRIEAGACPDCGERIEGIWADA
ncbi:MAG: AmmeMemoRadiSam system radical SAM enzyme [Deltaproteobacteria bacterium]|nr:AmmeMemoRadiSam system radical SAM enzyme [Deltaproteobacteria bacterium]